MLRPRNHYALNQDAIYPVYPVILNWNLPEDTIQCVESVQEALSAIDKFEGSPAASPEDASVAPQYDDRARLQIEQSRIVVVDNGSDDDSVVRLQKRFGDSITILANPVNLGFAGGVNTGIAWSLEQGAQSVLVLNNDTLVDREMVAHLVSVAARNPRAGVVGPVIYYFDDPDRIWRFADRESGWFPLPRRVPDRVVKEAGGVPFRTDYVTACGMLVRREVLEAIGLFDTRYFMYFEDADFCRRARDAGYEIWCAPKARMWHKVSLSAQKARPVTQYAQAWGRIQFYRQHFHGFSRLLAFAYLLGRSVTATLRHMMSGEWELIGPSWAGFVDGQLDRLPRLSDYV